MIIKKKFKVRFLFSRIDVVIVFGVVRLVIGFWELGFNDFLVIDSRVGF